MSQDVGGSVLRLGGEDHKGAEECGGAGENAPFHGWIAKCHQRDATQDAIAIEVADLIGVSVCCSLSVGVLRMVELLGLSFTIWYCSCTEQDPAACKIVWGDWRCPSCNLCKLRCQNNGPSGITYSTDSIDWDMLRSFQIFPLRYSRYSYLLISTLFVRSAASRPSMGEARRIHLGFKLYPGTPKGRAVVRTLIHWSWIQTGT